MLVKKEIPMTTSEILKTTIVKSREEILAEASITKEQEDIERNAGYSRNAFNQFVSDRLSLVIFFFFMIIISLR